MTGDGVNDSPALKQAGEKEGRKEGSATAVSELSYSSTDITFVQVDREIFHSVCLSLFYLLLLLLSSSILFLFLCLLPSFQSYIFLLFLFTFPPPIFSLPSVPPSLSSLSSFFLFFLMSILTHSLHHFYVLLLAFFPLHFPLLINVPTHFPSLLDVLLHSLVLFTSLLLIPVLSHRCCHGT